MNTVRQFLDLFQDSPTYGRDRANLITGFSVGTTGLLLNGAVLILMLPVMLNPDNGMFRSISDGVEFGQLLALILLGGATAFATVLIPLRLVTVFWEPRVGRYFDQIVLSGISPLRFVIGKATSQNLFLGLILFLLLPYLVLSLTLGGVHLIFFMAGLFLVWLYCMALALVTLWVSLYLNELLSAMVVITVAGFVSIWGCMPMQFQFFVMTPFPALVHPVLTSIPPYDDIVGKDFLPVFSACALSMTALICISLFAISLGPLYGIIRENSAFGEVVREGDSKRKRWFRIRLHIQRSSELAFFYENRDRSFLRHEGCLRWGGGFCALLLVWSAARLSLAGYASKQLGNLNQSMLYWQISEIHALNLTIHVLGLLAAVILFSHSKNTTYVSLPFLRGRQAEVARLDTITFLLFVLISTAGSIATPFLFERYLAEPRGTTLFLEHSDLSYMQGQHFDFMRYAIEGSALITLAGLVVYALQRLLCLWMWVRSAAFALVAVLYLVVICIMPIFFSVMLLEMTELRNVPPFPFWAANLAVVSPLMVLVYLLTGQMGPAFPTDVWTAPSYIVHGAILGLTLIGIRRYGRRLRPMYLARPVQKAIDRSVDEFLRTRSVPEAMP